MAGQVIGKMRSKEPIAFGRGRQSLEQSVWYSGWLLSSIEPFEGSRVWHSAVMRFECYPAG